MKGISPQLAEGTIFPRGKFLYTKVAISSLRCITTTTYKKTKKKPTTAKEFVQRKIRVNCISPALTDTPLITSRKESGGIYADNGTHLQKLGYIEPMQIAYLTEFLLSEKAKYITAANIEVNAAWNYE